MARLALSLIVLSLALAACGESESEQPDEKPKPAAAPAAKPADEIVIKDFEYGPPSASVKPGSKVTFVNRDSAPHTATVKGGGFDTGNLDKGQSKAITVDKPGTYDYVCEFHAFMKGKVTVR
jgi:plastocyanin